MKYAEDVSPVLIRKYNQPVPRYTSYPTVPHWSNSMDNEKWMQAFDHRFNEQNHIAGISLYIHLPFCESLCTYCGCNKKITTNHSVEEKYIAAVEKEWSLYRKGLAQTPVIRELHLGGGTPTFFSPRNLKRLLQFILGSSVVHPQRQFSFEGHPNNTTEHHLRVLYDLGFRRVSFGVQDNDPEVQRVINRIQPFENVRQATETARRIGYTSVNFDLIYGLPLQTTDSIARTMNEVLTLRPDRIAFYSYAHVPWTSKAQRLFNESHLPSAEEKVALYVEGKTMLVGAGYADIGFDHFALPTDELYIAREEGRLHRNFMGYTTQATGMLLGLGVSAISDAGTAFAQNEKTIQQYYAAIENEELAIKKGHVLSEEDLHFRKYIMDISCKSGVRFLPEHLPLLRQYTFPKLMDLQADGLLTWDETGLQLTPKGHFFIRNICAAFDLHLQTASAAAPIFSQAV